MKLILLMALTSNLVFANYQYPIAKKITQTETRFGHTIVDDYKWMENENDPDLWDWIDEQKSFSKNTLDSNLVQEFYNDIKLIRDSQNRAQQSKKISQIPLMMMEPDLSEQILALKEKYTVKEQSIFGGDFSRITIIENQSNTIADVLLVKFYSIIRLDDEFIYYTSDRDARLGGSRNAIFKHKIGSVQSDDEVLYEAQRTDNYISVVKEQENSIIISESNSYFEDQFLAEIDINTKEVLNKKYYTGSLIGELSTNEMLSLDSSKTNNGELYTYNIKTGVKKLLLAEQDSVIEGANVINENIIAVKLQKDAENSYAIFDTTTSQLTDIDLPKGGSIYFGGTWQDSILFSHISYNNPAGTYLYDLKKKEVLTWQAPQSDIPIEAEKIHYTATNGQKAAIWILKKKGTVLGPKTPTILYGYGGFKVTILPSYNFSNSLPWLDKGGVFAIVSLPGSLTYGEDWNKLALKGGRIHAWDSFAEAGKELIKRGYTSSNHLGMMGGSNGGLLVAGTLQRHPELFKAATPMVGVLDLYNFSLFTAGKYWQRDYGNPFIEKDFNQIKDLSPYHNLVKRDYPAVMVMTAEFDDRVVPMHSYKYAAKLQEFQTGDAPISLYVKEWGGHSSRSGSENQLVSFMASLYAFFAQNLEL